jgi:hypothetical protein
MSKKYTSRKENTLLEHRLEQAHQQKRRLAHKLDEVKKAYLDGRISKAQYIKHSKHAAYNKHAEHYDKKIKRYKKSLYGHKTDSQLLMLLLVVGMLGIMVIGSSFGPGLISGYVTSGTKTEAVIQQYFAVALSNNLADGIEFGTILFDTANNSATDNYNGLSNGTTLYVILSNNSNVHIDSCIKANADLINANNDTIAAENITWSYANTTSSAVPSLSNGTRLSKTFADGLQDITPGYANYMRFWLDVPDAQPPGTYNNTIEFQGVKTGVTCN